MSTFTLVLLMAGVVCLFAQALGVTAGRVSLGWLGLGFIVLIPLIERLSA